MDKNLICIKCGNSFPEVLFALSVSGSQGICRNCNVKVGTKKFLFDFAEHPAEKPKEATIIATDMIHLVDNDGNEYARRIQDLFDSEEEAKES